MSSEKTKLLLCSFCGKNQHDVQKLIAGPSVFICDECIELCNEVIRSEIPSSARKCSDVILKNTFIYQLLNHYFVGLKKQQIETCSFEVTSKNIPCPESFINDWLVSNQYGYERVGVSRRYYSKRNLLNLGDLWEQDVQPLYIGPVQYFLKNSKDVSSRYLKNGLWLCTTNSTNFVIFLDHGQLQDDGESTCLFLEIAAIPEELQSLSKSFFEHISKTLGL